MQFLYEKFLDEIKNRKNSLFLASPLQKMPFKEDKNEYSEIQELNHCFDYIIFPRNLSIFGIDFYRKSFEKFFNIKYFNDVGFDLIVTTLADFERFKLILSCHWYDDEIFSEIELNKDNVGKIFPATYDLLALKEEFNHWNGFLASLSENHSEKDILEAKKNCDNQIISNSLSPEKIIISSEKFLKYHYHDNPTVDSSLEYGISSAKFHKIKELKKSSCPLLGKIEFELYI